MSNLLQQYAKIKPIEVDSRVAAAESQQEKHLNGDYSTSTICDDMDIDVLDLTLIDCISHTGPHTDIGIVPHLYSEDMLLSPRSPEDDDADISEGMDLSQEDTHFVPHTQSPSLPTPRLQPPDSVLCNMAQRSAPSTDRADDTTAQLTRRSTAAQGEQRHTPPHRAAASAAGPRNSATPRHHTPAPSGDGALDAELDVVMHNWRVMHGIAGRAAAAPPSPLAPGSTHASFQLAG